jgi:hypothetical protein
LVGFAAEYTNVSAASTTHYQENLGNAFTVGRTVGSNAGVPINATFTPGDAFTIDTKTDDGIPSSGNWIADLTGGGNFGTANACTTDANSASTNGSYRTDISLIACSFYIKSGY